MGLLKTLKNIKKQWKGLSSSHFCYFGSQGMALLKSLKSLTKPLRRPLFSFLSDRPFERPLKGNLIFDLKSMTPSQGKDLRGEGGEFNQGLRSFLKPSSSF